jgi:hypothetical protein
MPAQAVTATATWEDVPPVAITTQPAPLTIAAHGSIEGALAVEASTEGGAALAYRWFVTPTGNLADGVPVDDAVSAQFTLPANLATGTYYYYCVVSGAGGVSATSEIATVAVVASMPAVPVFYALAAEYTAGSAAMPLGVYGEGSALLTKLYVNGVAATVFNPAAAGTYLIEAASADGKLKIWKYVTVKSEK